jgi:hypothetical protein
VSKSTIEERLATFATVAENQAKHAKIAADTRDILIREAHQQGLGYGTIAKHTRLSRARVQQICNAA